MPSSLGALHVVAVHFPIALALAAALAELLAMVRGERALRHAARFCITCAACAGLVAIASGWQLASSMDAQGLHAELVERHRWSGIGACIAACAAALAVRACERPNGARMQLAYRVCLWSAAGLTALAAWQGGALAYGL